MTGAIPLHNEHFEQLNALNVKAYQWDAIKNSNAAYNNGEWKSGLKTVDSHYTHMRHLNVCGCVRVWKCSIETHEQ